MSIQFRARIKSAGDYTSLLSDTGVCCYPDGSQSEVEIAYITCMNAGGYFQYVQVLQGEIPSEVVCPDLSDTGCCCACEYVDDYDAYLQSVEDGSLIPQYTSGLKDVSLCECNRIGGVWSVDSCDTYKEWEDIFNLCTGGAYSHGTPDPVEHDRRFPEGCCVSHQDGSDVDGGPYKECVHVCSSGECSDLQEAAWPREQCCPDVANESLCIDCPECCASHYATVACGNDPTIPEQDQIMCGEETAAAYAAGGTAFLDDEFDNILVIPKQSREKNIEERYKNTIAGKGIKGVSSVCITTKDRVNYDCKIKTENLCSGIWMGLNDAGFPFKCNDSEVTTIKDFLKNGTVSREVVDGWKIGQYQIAGYYAGVFNYGGEDGHHESLEGLGNPKTGRWIDYKLEGVSNDVKEFKSFTKSQYAVLILPKDLEDMGGSTVKPIKLHSNNRNIINQSVSKFDSVRNMLTPLDRFNDVNSYIYNGIGGWAIPSHYALAWIAKQIQKPEFIENTKNNKAYKWEDMIRSYWSSTLLGVNNHQLIMAYIQDFDTKFVSVCPITRRRHWTRPVRFVKISPEV